MNSNVDVSLLPRYSRSPNGPELTLRWFNPADGSSGDAIIADMQAVVVKLTDDQKQALFRAMLPVMSRWLEVRDTLDVSEPR